MMSKEDQNEVWDNLLRDVTWLTWVDENPEDAYLISMILERKCYRYKDVNKEMKEMR